MTSDSMRRIFSPKSIAVVGASREPGKLGHITLRNLIEGGFKGKIFPINSEVKEILGLEAYQSVKEIAGNIDLAVIVVPAAVVPRVVQDCCDKEIKAVIIISAGFRETGSQGEAFEREVLKVAREGETRILGPNCMGVVNASEYMDASMSRVIDPKALRSGGIAFVSQSGAFGAALYSWAQGMGICFDKLVSLGNACDIDECDILEYLSTDAKTRVIAMYMESVKDGRKFMQTAKKTSTVKPIVILKIGRSTRGAQAAKSHTGALTGSSAIYDAAFKQAGVIKANNTTQLFNFAKAFATQPLPTGNKIVIVTTSGGPGVAAADACEQEGLELAEIDDDTRRRIKALLPPFASTLNPIDTTASRPRISAEILRILLNEKTVDGAISIIVGSRPREYAEEVVNVHVAAATVSNKPLLVSWTADKSAQDMVTSLQENNVPVYEAPEEAVESMGALKTYAEFLKRYA